MVLFSFILDVNVNTSIIQELTHPYGCGLCANESHHLNKHIIDFKSSSSSCLCVTIICALVGVGATVFVLICSAPPKMPSLTCIYTRGLYLYFVTFKVQNI